MAELYEDWLVSKMTRAEYNELSDDEKKERKRLQKRQHDINYTTKYPEKVKEQKANQYKKNSEAIKARSKKWHEDNPEKVKESERKYREKNPEKVKEYNRQYKQSPTGKKKNTISQWVNDFGLQESDEDLDRIYDLWLNQELCNACDCVLTRSGKLISTDATMDHDHDTHRFRHIICRSCNTQDNWKKYFC